MEQDAPVLFEHRMDKVLSQMGGIERLVLVNNGSDLAAGRSIAPP